MNLNVFKPAQPGLTPEELEARNKREKLVLSSLACVLTNAPMPDAFAVATMQRFVDGELTLNEVKEVLLADTKAMFGQVPGEKVA